MKAIILAAGYGSRMYPLMQNMPKCLLTINGEILLSRQVRIMRNCGIEDITIVTGFHQEKIVELYGEEISIRYNPHYEITGNIFSLWVARNLLDDDVILINADVVYTDRLIKELLRDDNVYCLVVDKRAAREDERKVRVVDNLIFDTSMIMPASDASGEAIGIAKVKKEGIEAFKKSLFESVKRDSHLGWLDTFTDLAEHGEKVNYILIDSPWIEIDTMEDYNEAKKLFENEAYS